MLGSKRYEGRGVGRRSYETPFTKLPNSRGAGSSPFSEGPLGSLLTESPWGGKWERKQGKAGRRMVSANAGETPSPSQGPGILRPRG